MRVQLHLGGPAPEHQPYAGGLRLGHEQLVVGALRPGPRGQPVRQQPVLGPLQLDRARTSSAVIGVVIHSWSDMATSLSQACLRSYGALRR